MGQIVKGMEQRIIRQMQIHKRKLRGVRGVYFEDIEPLAFPKLWVNAFVLASDPDIGGYRHQ